MGITVVAVAVGLALGYLRGGRIANVGDHAIRLLPVLVVGLVLQGLLFGTSRGWWVLLVVSYGCLLAFAVVNRSIAGMGVVAFGVLCNLLVVTLNAGMPVRPQALVRAGIIHKADIPNVEVKGKRHVENDGDKLMFLADVIPVPLPVQPYVVSFGDLIMYVGLADVVFHLMRPRRRPKWLDAFDRDDEPDLAEPPADARATRAETPLPAPSPDRRRLATTATLTAVRPAPATPLVPVSAPEAEPRRGAFDVLEAPLPVFGPPAPTARAAVTTLPSLALRRKVRKRVGRQRRGAAPAPAAAAAPARPPKTAVFDQDLWDTGRHAALKG